MSEMIDLDSALLDQTMLCEASRLLDGYPEGFEYANEYFDRASILKDVLGPLFMASTVWMPPSNVERLFNLSMLLDGLAMHEHLYVLKAELPPDADTLQLRQLLIGKGIVKEIDTLNYKVDIQREFNNFFKKIRQHCPDISFSGEQRVKLVLDAMLNSRELYSDYILKSSNPPLLEGLRQDYANMYSTQYFGHHELRRDYSDNSPLGRNSYFSTEYSPLPFLDLGLYFIDRFDSGRSIGGVSYLRSYVYWRVSEHAKIPFYPSSRRIPLIYGIADHINLYTSEEVYRAVAEAFKENSEFVVEEDAKLPLSLPPALAIFLDIYRSTRDLSQTIDNFRYELADVRLTFQSFREKSRAAGSLKEKRIFKYQLTDSIKMIRSRYRRDNSSAWEEIIGFAPDVLNPLSNPLDPSKYSDKLITKPAKWIRDWWKRKPLQHVFHLQDRLDQIIDYSSLASDALDLDFHKEDASNFKKYYDEYFSLYRKKNW